MIDNEKYGIEIEAKTNPFIQKMQELAGFIRKFGKETEKNTTISPNIKLENDLKYFENMRDKYVDLYDKTFEKYKKRKPYTKDGITWDKEPEIPDKVIDKLNTYSLLVDHANNKIKELKELLKGIEINPYKSLEETEKDVENLTDKTKDLNNEQKEYNDELNEMGDDGKKSTSMLSNLFDKSIGKIKRFTYYLLGARSVFSLFMRYRSIFYQFNEEMQYQSELSQNAIALSLAPAFEYLGNVVAYASIGIAKFIELLTGVNVLSKVTTKGIRDYNKSLKETQTLASGIDEITNLSLPSSTGLASQYSALEEFQKKVAEVTKWFDENTWISDIVKGLKDAYNYVSSHWDVFKYLFGAIALTGVVFDLGIKVNGLMTALGTAGTIGTLGSVGTGLSGLASVLSFLSTLGTIAIVLTITSIVADKLTEDILMGNVDKYKEGIASAENSKVKDTLNTIENAMNRMNELSSDSEEYKELASQIKDAWDKISTIMSENSVILYDNKEKAEELKQKFDEMTQDDYEVKIELKLPTREMTIWDKFRYNFYNSLADMTSFIPSVSRYFRTKSIEIPDYNYNGYAKGLDYVPYDEYPALLHKGEAVVPAKYNPTIHSQGNEYTNSLLETLIVSVQDLANRPNVFEVDGNQFAKATYPLYRNEEYRQNYNAKVSVR